MRLTSKGRYAVTAMLDVALHSQQTPVPLADISERQGISRAAVAALREGGCIQPVRALNSVTNSCEKAMADNIHDVQIDPRNLNILISVNGKLVPRAEAVVSVFDSGFILGDGVWEGLRLVKGGVPFLREHIERLYEGAKAIFMEVGLTPADLVQRLFDCIDANRMEDGAHLRLMVTRGRKRSINQAVVADFPVPVAPSSTTSSTPASILRAISSMACG